MAAVNTGEVRKKERFGCRHFGGAMKIAERGLRES
jgi:hypothetical protein